MKTSHWKDASELTHEEWRERLLAYIRLGDREVDPVFEGRGDLFEAVEDRVTRATNDREYGNLTTVIGGAPGAGKSAFVAECIRRQAESGMARAVPLLMEVDRMTPQEFVRLIAEALDAPLDPQTAKSHEKAGSVNAGLAAGEYRRVTERTTPSLLDQADKDGPVPWNVIRDEFGEMLGGRPILLFVDEAQNFEKAGNPHHAIPGSLHNGAPRNGVPIIPVYTGLADTAATLRTEARLTRSVEDNAISLGGLSERESREYASTILRDYFGLNAPGPHLTAVYDWMTAEGSNWPQHIRSQLAAFANGMLAADSRSLSALDMARLKERVETRRQETYEDRAANVAGDRFPDVARAVVLHAAEHGGCEWEPLALLAHRYLDGRIGTVGATSYIDQMIHAGMLQRDRATGLYDCPIPSLRSWLETGRHVSLPFPRMEPA